MTEPKVGDEVGVPTPGVDELDPDVRNDPLPEPAVPSPDDEESEDDGSTTEPEA